MSLTTIAGLAVAYYAGFLTAAILNASGRADETMAAWHSGRRKGLVEGAGLTPTELRMALGPIPVEQTPDPLEDPANWGAM